MNGMILICSNLNLFLVFYKKYTETYRMGFITDIPSYDDTIAQTKMDPGN